MKIYQCKTQQDQTHVKDLFWEYLQWANGEVRDHFDVKFDIKAMLIENMKNLDRFFPPEGRLFLVRVDGQIAGVGCLRKLKEDIGEIKRMYVRPKHRRKGIGKLLLEHLLDAATEAGYKKVWLDSAKFMEKAHSLYRSAGFEEIDPYPESEIPKEFQPNWVFMEKKF